MTEFKLEDVLLEVCGDNRIFEKDIDLIESGLLDSLALIELISHLDDQGMTLHLTRIDRDCLRTIEGIKQLIKEATDSCT